MTKIDTKPPHNRFGCSKCKNTGDKCLDWVFGKEYKLEFSDLLRGFEHIQTHTQYKITLCSTWHLSALVYMIDGGKLHPNRVINTSI